MTQRWIPSGRKGGSKGKGGDGGGGGVEAPDSLRSIQYAKVVDLVSEGIIQGLANGLQGVYYDGVRLQNPDKSFNFTSVNVYWTTGGPNQGVIPGQTGVSTPKSVGVQIKTTTPHVEQVNNIDADRVRITMSVPSLQEADKKGNVNGTTVKFDIYLQANGGGYKLLKNYSITGKTQGRYQRDITFPLTGTGPWDIRIVRVTPDSTSNLLANDLYWDLITYTIDAKIRYRNSAIVATSIDAAQFSSIPERTYEVYGMVIQVPSNYNASSRTYSPTVWDGTFKPAYSNNPAWIFYDLVTNTRYGIGTFIGPAQIDKWALYDIGRWCDEPVPNHKGGYEPRWVCNTVISDRQEAFDLLQSLASTFRGAHFWTGGKLVTIADKPVDPLGMFTNANVINGVFTYQGSDMRARHTQVAVTWSDPDNLGQPRVTLVEDQDGISRYGLNKLDLTGIGCTSEGQAIRIGRWALYSELNETETVKFSVGLDGAWCKPGDVIQIADLLVAGERRGGRLELGTKSDQLVIDYSITFHAVNVANVSVVRADGVMVTVPVNISAINEPQAILYPTQTIEPPPLVGSPWVLSTGDLATQLFRVIAVEQADDDVTFSITALSHNPTKWAYVERAAALSDRDVTNFGLPTIYGLGASETLISFTAVSVTINLSLSWQSTAPRFEVRWRKQNSNWTTTTTQALAIDLPVDIGIYEFVVTPLSSAGFRGQSATLTHEVIGLAGNPNDVRNFRIQNVNGMAHLTWAPATDADVLAGGTFELRFSPRTSGIGWSSGNIIVMAIPGNATTVEVPYRQGTYMIKAKDTSGIYSNNAASVVTYELDPLHSMYTQICESPNWTGTFDNTSVQLPQQWLRLYVQGGYWDDQLDLMSTWSGIDNLPVGTRGVPPGIGYYYFAQQIDMGGVFPVRLTADMVAFPYLVTTVFVDDRTGIVDGWSDWDAADADANGMAVMEIRQTDDDPASPGAVWSAWGGMQASDYTGRGFQFRIRLECPAGQAVAVEEACITVDFSAKQDNGADIPWVPTGPMHITFGIKFFEVPAIAIAIQDGVVGDVAKLTNKTPAGFDIQLFKANGTVIVAGDGPRTFDWQAQGFGYILGMLGITEILSCLNHIVSTFLPMVT